MRLTVCNLGLLHELLQCSSVCFFVLSWQVAILACPYKLKRFPCVLFMSHLLIFCCPLWLPKKDIILWDTTATTSYQIIRWPVSLINKLQLLSYQSTSNITPRHSLHTYTTLPHYSHIHNTSPKNSPTLNTTTPKYTLPQRLFVL